MITEVTLENFKSHRHTQLKFDDSRLHAIVGQNSSGKTSVLQAMLLLFDEHQQVLSFEMIMTIGATQSSVSVEGIFKEKGITQELGLKTGSVFNGVWDIPSNDPISPRKWSINGSILNKKLDVFYYGQKTGEILAQHKLALLSLNPQKLVAPGYSEEIKPSISFDGSGMAPALDYIRYEYPENFLSLEEMLRRVVPDVKKVGLRRAKVPVDREKTITVDNKSFSYDEKQELIGQEVVLDMKSGDRIPGHALSEGTILTLGLLTVLMSPQRPNLILLDDIQQGLHPKAQRELMTVIQEIIDTNPELQIIFTTHSPYIIDELKPSQVHILHSDADGFACHRRLDEHPEVDWALQTLTTGEFWGAEGEEWVASAQTQGTKPETSATEAAETTPS